ncbi:hypothetical protein ACJX0J_023840, partial [Zea mays]
TPLRAWNSKIYVQHNKHQLYSLQATLLAGNAGNTAIYIMNLPRSKAYGGSRAANIVKNFNIDYILLLLAKVRPETYVFGLSLASGHS